MIRKWCWWCNRPSRLAKLGGISAPARARTGIFKDRKVEDIDIDSALDEMNAAWKSRLGDLSCVQDEAVGGHGTGGGRDGQVGSQCTSA